METYHYLCVEETQPMAVVTEGKHGTNGDKNHILGGGLDVHRKPSPCCQEKDILQHGQVLFGERDSELFKKLGDTEIWEFRTLYDKTAYRLFAFWDKDDETFVVATHGIVKKSQRTPEREIEKAERLRKEYFNDKKQG